MQIQPPDGPTAGSYLKLQRARDHLRALEQEVDAFLRRQPYPVRTEPDAESDRVRFLAVIPEQPAPRLGLIVGDVVHNLRTSLDHLVSECVVLNGGTPTDEHAYPVSRSKQWFETVGRRWLEGTAPEFVDEVERMQPHQALDPKMHLLYTLHELDIIDKHRTMLPLVGIVRQPEYVEVPAAAEGSTERPLYFGWALRDGDPVLSLPRIYLQPGVQPTFTRAIGVDVPLPHPATDIVDRLTTLFRFVERERARLKAVAMWAASRRDNEGVWGAKIRQ